jgi:hypothetical protein
MGGELVMGFVPCDPAGSSLLLLLCSRFCSRFQVYLNRTRTDRFTHRSNTNLVHGLTHRTRSLSPLMALLNHGQHAYPSIFWLASTVGTENAVP